MLTVISKSPELHSLDLENCAQTKTDIYQVVGKIFHFYSANYGYYCCFSYLHTRFLNTRRGKSFLPANSASERVGEPSLPGRAGSTGQRGRGFHGSASFSTRAMCPR